MRLESLPSDEKPSLSVGLIRFYQKHKPERFTNVCRFTPSCSNYAIIAIQKYGFIKGWQKAINRLRRCHYPNGGEDLP